MPFARTATTAALILVLAAALAGARGAARAAEPPPAWRDAALCSAAIAAAERREALPLRLLTAVSLAESGRWDEERRESFAWPWTVTSGGTGQYFPDKRAAIAAVKRLRAKGVRNIDVGCLQVNLSYHPDAFDDLDAAFDPATNAAYAAHFLKSLRIERHAWSIAVGYYHSSRPDEGRRYSDKVFDLWHAANRRVYKETLAARARTVASRRAEYAAR
jgi:hypothetical protein